MQTKRCQKFPALRKRFSRPELRSRQEMVAEHGPKEIFFKNFLLTRKCDSRKETTTGPIEQEVGWTPEPVRAFEQIVGVLC